MDELDELRAEAAARGVKVDGRWGVDRLRAEISDAQPGEADDDEQGDADDELGDEQLDDEADDDEGGEVRSDGLTPYIRAGGHIDRGDGRGWVIEE